MLFCLAAPIIATYTWLQYKKMLANKEVKQQVSAGMDKEELVVLKFTREEVLTVLRWKDAKEFEYHGQMYDISEIEIKGDTIYYWCWWDHEETKLNRHLNDVLAYALGKDAPNKDTQKRLAHFFRSLFCSKALPWQLLIDQQARRRAFAYFFKWPSIYLPPPAPPPEYT